MRISGLLLLSLLFLLMTSCRKEQIRGSGPLQEVTRDLQSFARISSSGSTNVHIEEGPALMVKINGYANLIPYFETVVQNGELKLGFKNNVSVQNDNISVHIVIPVLSGVAISGSSTINVSGNFPEVPEFVCNISGSGKASVGNLEALNFRGFFSGSGEMYAFGLQCLNADIHMSGSGVAEISVQNNLNATISGDAIVYYRGHPVVNATISGSGRVIQQ